MNEEFKKSFASVLRRISDKRDMVVRKVIIQTGRAVIQRSPVDTGRFRGNWQFGISSINTDTSSSNDRGGTLAMGRIAVGMNSWKTGQFVFITNSLPYARMLEYGGYPDGPKTVGGYSRQAPAGMVRVTVNDFKQFLKRAGESE